MTIVRHQDPVIAVGEPAIDPASWPASPPWTGDANCADYDPELFFPDRAKDNDAARRICAGCSVRQACLEYALQHEMRLSTSDFKGHIFGIFGGLTARERRKLIRGGHGILSAQEVA